MKLCARVAPASFACRAAMITALPLLLLRAASSQDVAQDVRILYPSNRSVHDTRPVRLLVATPLATTKLAATLDGKPLALRRMTFADTWMLPGKLKATAALVGERSAAALWAAPLSLAPGAHTVVVGGRKLELRGAKGTPPAGWTPAYAHSPVASEAGKLDCAGCHSLEGGVLDTSRTPDACASCHDEASVQLIHHHVPEPLAKCALCHDPHGGERPKLLVDAKEKLCSKCHEAGHSKE